MILRIAQFLGLLCLVVATAFSFPLSSAAQPLLGINLEGTADWEPIQIWANIIRQGRRWSNPDNPNGSVAANWVTWDENGEPLEDAGLILMIGLPASAAGVYKLSFTGQAEHISFPNSGNVTLVNKLYDPRQNRTTADVVVGLVNGRCSDLWMVFRGTRRRPSDPVGSGIKEVRLMRPGHGEGELFNRDFLQRLSPFSVLRLHQFQGVGGMGINDNLDTHWQDRVKPSWYSSGNQNGSSYEHAILLANTTHKDLWLHIPFYATDDYIAKMAQLFAYGSDGVDPYSSPQANPRYPPLDPDRTIYLELSNEIWNGGYWVAWWNQALAYEEMHPVTWTPHSVYDAPDWSSITRGVVRYNGNRYQCILGGVSGATGPTGVGADIVDGTVHWRYVDRPPSGDNPYHYNGGGNFHNGQQRIGRRLVEISARFRGVFGDGAMMTRIRPVATAQYGNIGTYSYLDYVAGEYGPVANHFYATGGAPYIVVNDENADGLSVDEVITQMAASAASLGAEAAAIKRIADAHGIKMVTYEGGAGNFTGHSDAAKRAAQADPRMKDVVLTLLNAFYAAGGELFTYYTLCNSAYFGLSTDITIDATPKWDAIKALAPSGLAQGISRFTPLASIAYGDAPLDLTADASSGLPIVYTVLSGPGSIVGNRLTPTGAGTITLKASQPGDGSYAPAPDQIAAITVLPRPLTITADTIGRPYNTANPARFPFTVSGLAGTDTVTGVTTTVAASATMTAPVGSRHAVTPGSAVFGAGMAADYDITYVSGLLTVTPEQMITFLPLAAARLGSPDVAPIAFASSGLPVSLASDNPSVATIVNGMIHLVSGGRATITASQAGDASFLAAPAVSQTLLVGAPPLLGINLRSSSPDEPQQLWANVIRQGSRWLDLPHWSNSPVPSDANGEPLTDAGLMLMRGLPASHAGTYKLSFTGQAARIEFPNSGNVTLANAAYDAALNRTTADVIVGTTGTNCSNLWMTLTGTRRHPSDNSSAGTGVSDVRLMRPGHAETELFNRAFLARLAPFGLLRLMQYQGGDGWNAGVNDNLDSKWEERVRPGRYTANNRNGASFEHAILLANATGKDLWISVPFFADDDYITRMAQLFAYGSDGTTPYSAPHANPIYPPLAPERKLYLEFSNELWSGGYLTTYWNLALAYEEMHPADWAPERAYDPPDWSSFTRGVVRNNANRYQCVTAGVSGATGPTGTGADIIDGTVHWRYLDTPPAGANPYHYTGGTDHYQNGRQRQGRRLTEISALLRKVFGDSAMMTRIRPIATGQYDNAGTYYYLNYLTAEYGPVSSSIYGMGGAPFIGADNETATNLTQDDVITQMAAAAVRLGDAATRAKTLADQYGLTLVTYGGGSGNYAGYSDAAKQAAQRDPRMKEVLLTLMNAFYTAGGELFTYSWLTSGSGADYRGLADDINDDVTPKWDAIRAITAGFFVPPKGTQSIVLGPSSSLAVGASAQLSAVGGASGNPVLFNSTSATCRVNATTVTGISPGVCRITADQAGNATFDAAPQAILDLMVAKGSQLITIGALPEIGIGGSGVVKAAASSGLPVTVSSLTPGICRVSGTSVITVTGLVRGDCILAADQGGNADYDAASRMTRGITIGRGRQTIAFGPAPVVTVGGAGRVTATGGGSGNPVIFSSQTPGICSVTADGMVAGIAAGVCTVVADQAGNSDYEAAPAALLTVPPLMGINLEGTSDYEPMQMWANVMRQGRRWMYPYEWRSEHLVPSDENGEPLADGGIILMIGLPATNAGTYTLSFTGQAAGIEFPFSAATLINKRYDPYRNRTTADVVLEAVNGRCDLWLVLSGTRRNPDDVDSAGLGTGVKDVRLMRPGHDESEIFNRAFLASLAPFRVLRIMQYLGAGGMGINNNLDTHWADRVRPDWFTSQNQNGSSLEHAVLLANATGKDLWLNIPFYATDDYITKAARLFAYGSDGTNPYDAPQAHPVYPPLAPDRKIYLEFGNEFWNGGYMTAWWNQALAYEEVHPTAWAPNTSYDAPDWTSVTRGVVRFNGNRYQCTVPGISGGSGPTGTGGDIIDGTVHWRFVDSPPPAANPYHYTTTDLFQLGQQRMGRRLVEISARFRRVFGDGAMMSRVRPAALAQFGNGGTFDYLDYLRGEYGLLTNLLYATGGSPGLLMKDELADNLTVDDVITQLAAGATQMANDSRSVKQIADAHGLKMLTYEAGVGGSGGHSDAAKLAAQTDPRMKGLVLTLMNSYYAAGGELLTYYTLCGGWNQWGYFGLTNDINTLVTPKFAAMQELAAAPFVIGKGSQTITFGTPLSIIVGGSDALRVTGGGSGNPVLLSSSSATCSVSGSTVTGLAPGPCVITARQAGTADYEAAPPASQTVTIVTPVQVTVQSVPAGMSYRLDGIAFVAAQTHALLPGSTHTLATTSPQSGPAGTRYAFASWSDHGAISHTLTVPATGSSSVTASFSPILPTVTTLAPVTGAAGTRVTITGTNFLGATGVTFNTTQAAVFAVASATSMTAMVPLGATTGKISVTTPSGTGTSAASFTVPAPTVTRFTPTSGLPGATVTITGTNLTGATAVTLNGVAATITSITATSLRFVIPVGATTGLIKVTTAAGAGTSSTSFSVPAPTVTSFTPTSALVGATVTITGTGLGSASAVKFNGVPALIVSNTTTSISARIPAGATTGPISITTAAGTGTSAKRFTVPAPTITTFTPTTGGVSTGVNITGANFTGATHVKFNGTEATFVVVSATSIATSVPSGAITGRLTVTTYGGSVTSAGNFTVGATAAVPKVTSFTPATGGRGTSVAITGGNLVGATAVKFNGVTAPFTVISNSSLVTAVPAGASSGTITITAAGGSATSTAVFTVGATPTAPTITTFTAASGNVGTDITVTGTNLGGVTSAKIGGLTASFKVKSTTLLTIAVPHGAVTGALSLTTDGGTATSSRMFTVTP